MCIPKKKKRKQVALELEEITVVEDESVAEPEPVVQPLVVVMPCPQTQPRIHVKCSTCNKDVAGVQVTLGGVDLGRTGRDGKTAPKPGGMVPGKGIVALVQGERPGHVLTREFEVVYPKRCTDTFIVRAKCVAHLIVEVLRYDGQPVKGGRVTFEIDGPDGKKNETTAAFKGRDDQPPRDIEEERKELPAVPAGAYTITLANVPALVAAQKPDPMSAEVWKLGPNDQGVAKLTLKAGATHHARFVLTKYTKIQFVGLEIEPSTQGDPWAVLPSGEIYMGDDNADRDIGDRSIVLKNAIKQAVASPDVDTDPEVLKVFMTAEFYWRGSEGAYPIEKMSKIMDMMREETGKPAYADWLFVHGTAIGYLPHGDNKATVRKFAIQGASGAKASSFTIVEIPGSKERVGVCAQIPDNWDHNDLTKVPKYHWMLCQGSNHVGVVKATAGVDAYTLQVDEPVAFADGAVWLVEPIATEVFNVALVQKGGPGSGVAGLREAIVYKEEISAIDYLGVMFGKHEKFHRPSGDNRKIEIHGQVRRVLPTSGARDVLGASPNVPGQNNVSERTEHGLGGGSILEIDGITFGLEICRDHLQCKLKRYYEGDPDATPPQAATASAGEPKIQAQLIPSWGAFVKAEAVVGVDGVLVFNVDGPDGAKAGAITGEPGWECPHHLGTVSKQRAKCTAGPHFTCVGAAPVQSDCPHCGEEMKDTIPDVFCARPQHMFMGAAMCPLCGKANTLVEWVCPACKTTSPSPGACTHGGCGTKPARVGGYRCSEPHHRHDPPCPSFGSPAYICKNLHRVSGAPGDCGSCGRPRFQVDWWRELKEITPETGAAPITVADTPGTYTKVTANEVDDDTSPTGKQTTYTTTTIASAPKQKDYFAKKGKVVVYPPLDIPDPDVV